MSREPGEFHENNNCGVLVGALDAGCDDTPVFLASFLASPSAGAVDLLWQLGSEQPSADFEMRADQAGTSWSVAWFEVAAGKYEALDDNAMLASGGQVTYQLSGKLPGEEWQILRTLTAEVPPVSGTRLLAAHPNPFNPATELGFNLVEPSSVNLAIYDLAGRQVVALLAGVSYDAGRHAVDWTGCDNAGGRLASGVYFVRFSAGAYNAESKLVLLK